MTWYGTKTALATYFMIAFAIEQLAETHVPYYDKMTFKGPFQHQLFCGSDIILIPPFR